MKEFFIGVGVFVGAIACIIWLIFGGEQLFYKYDLIKLEHLQEICESAKEKGLDHLYDCLDYNKRK